MEDELEIQVAKRAEELRELAEGFKAKAILALVEQIRGKIDKGEGCEIFRTSRYQRIA